MLQTPDDIITIQELIFKTKPEIIIEVGVAWAGTFLLNLYLITLIQKNHRNRYIYSKGFKKRIFIKKNKQNKVNYRRLNLRLYLIKLKKLCGKYKNILIHLDSDHTKSCIKRVKYYIQLKKKIIILL